MVGSLLHAIGIALQLSLLLCAVLAVGCSERGTSDAPRAPENERRPVPPSGGYEPIEVVNGGTITGRVTWSGARPEPVELPVATHAEVCGTTQRSPVLEVSARGGIAGTVVWLEGISQGRALAPAAEPVRIEIVGCRFRPHVLAVPVGAQVAFRNGDAAVHNVHATLWRGRDEQTWLSVGLPESGASHVATVERPGIVRVVDDAGHPWMLAWIHAFEHPYFAVTDAEGRFQLTGIPAGQYRLRAWHEGVRVTGETEAGRPVHSAPIVLTRPVTTSRGHDTTVDFVITAEAAEAAGGN